MQTKKQNLTFLYTRVVLTLSIVLLLLSGCRSSNNLNEASNNDQETQSRSTTEKIETFDETEASLNLDDAIVTPLGAWAPGFSYQYGVPIRFLLDTNEIRDEKIVFDITVDGGAFVGDINLDKYKADPGDDSATIESATLGNSFRIDNGETIFWKNVEVEEEDFPIYVDVVFYADDHVVGYAVCEIIHSNESSLMGARVLDCHYFNKVNGEFQSITYEYVKEIMSEIKG